MDLRELAFDNEKVIVWKTTISKNNPLKMHRHDAPRVVVVLKGGTIKKVESTGEISHLTFETGKAYWLDADEPGSLHADFCLSHETIEVMVIQLKN